MTTRSQKCKEESEIVLRHWCTEKPLPMSTLEGITMSSAMSSTAILKLHRLVRAQ
jgi:hypothetical protein